MKIIFFILFLISYNSFSQPSWIINNGYTTGINNNKIELIKACNDGNGLITYSKIDGLRFLQRIDSSGIILWTKALNITGEHSGNIGPDKTFRRDYSARSIGQLDNGDFVVTGTYDSLWESISMPLNGNNYKTSVITRFDNFGNILWNKSIDSTFTYSNHGNHSAVRFSSVIEDQAGDLFYLGPQTICKLNSSGDYLWSFKIPDSLVGQLNPNFTFLTSIASLSTGQLIISGGNRDGFYLVNFNTNNGLLQGRHFSYQAADVITEAFVKITPDDKLIVWLKGGLGIQNSLKAVVKLDTSFNILWSQKYFFPGLIGINNIFPISSTNYCVELDHDSYSNIDTSFRSVLLIDSSGAFQKTVTLKKDTFSDISSKVYYNKIQNVDINGRTIYSHYLEFIDDPPVTDYYFSNYIHKTSLDSSMCIFETPPFISDSSISFIQLPFSYNLVPVIDSVLILTHFTSDTVLTNSIFCESPVSVNEIMETKYINLYPNPTSSILNIETSEYNKSGTLELFDVTGKKILEFNFNSTGVKLIDVTFLSGGIYFVKIRSDNKNRVARFVKI